MTDEVFYSEKDKDFRDNTHNVRVDSSIEGNSSSYFGDLTQQNGVSQATRVNNHDAHGAGISNNYHPIDSCSGLAPVYSKDETDQLISDENNLTNSGSTVKQKDLNNISLTSGIDKGENKEVEKMNNDHKSRGNLSDEENLFSEWEKYHHKPVEIGGRSRGSMAKRNNNSAGKSKSNKTSITNDENDQLDPYSRNRGGDNRRDNSVEYEGSNIDDSEAVTGTVSDLLSKSHSGGGATKSMGNSVPQSRNRPLVVPVGRPKKRLSAKKKLLPTRHRSGYVNALEGGSTNINVENLGYGVLNSGTSDISVSVEPERRNVGGQEERNGVYSGPETSGQYREHVNSYNTRTKVSDLSECSGNLSKGKVRKHSKSSKIRSHAKSKNPGVGLKTKTKPPLIKILSFTSKATGTGNKQAKPCDGMEQGGTRGSSKTKRLVDTTCSNKKIGNRGASNSDSMIPHGRYRRMGKKSRDEFQEMDNEKLFRSLAEEIGREDLLPLDSGNSDNANKGRRNGNDTTNVDNMGTEESVLVGTLASELRLRSEEGCKRIEEKERKIKEEEQRRMEEERKRIEEEEERRRIEEEEECKRIEEEAERKRIEEEEEERKRIEEEAERKRIEEEEEERKRIEEEEERKRIEEEEERKRIEEEAERKRIEEEEEERKRIEEEVERKRIEEEEEERKRIEEEVERKRIEEEEEERKRIEEEEERKRIEEEVERKRIEEEEEERKRIEEEEERKRIEEEVERKRIEEEEERKRIEEEVERKRIEEEEGERRRIEEEERKRIEEEAERLRFKEEEEELKRIAEERRNLEEHMRLKEEERKRNVEEDQRRLEEERRLVEERKRNVEEEQRRLEEERRLVEERKRNVEEEQRRLGEEQKKLEDEQNRLSALKKKIDEEKVALEETKRQFKEGMARINDEQIKLEKAKLQIEEERIKMCEERIELERAKQRLEEKKKKLDDEKIKLEEIKQYSENGEFKAHDQERHSLIAKKMDEVGLTLVNNDPNESLKIKQLSVDQNIIDTKGTGQQSYSMLTDIGEQTEPQVYDNQKKAEGARRPLEEVEDEEKKKKVEEAKRAREVERQMIEDKRRKEAEETRRRLEKEEKMRKVDEGVFNRIKSKTDDLGNGGIHESVSEGSRMRDSSITKENFRSKCIEYAKDFFNIRPFIRPNFDYIPRKNVFSVKDKSIISIPEEVFLGLFHLTRDYESVSLYECFKGCDQLSKIEFPSWFDTSNVCDMSRMFHGCSKLESIDLAHVNTSNVLDMTEMFLGCCSLKALDLSSFRTSNVKYMGDMFSGCSSLNTLDLSSFSVESCYVARIFQGCSKLTDVKYSETESRIRNQLSLIDFELN